MPPGRAIHRAITAALAWSSPLMAQTVPPAAPPTREEINRIPTTTQPTPPARLTIAGGVERAACPLDAPRFQTVQLSLKDVVFDNVGPVDPASLRDAFAPYLSRTVAIGAICEIRDAAATLLRRQGYLAAVEVPPQRIGDGIVHLHVVLAKLVAIHVRGNPGHAEKLIAGYLERLKRADYFNQQIAERELLLAGDLPGFEIRLSLRPAGTATGELIGDVTVARIPFDTTANIQNFGSHAVGRWSGLVSTEANDLIGLGDRAVIGVDNTTDVREQTVVQAAYELRPDLAGIVFATRFTYAWTRPDISDGNPLDARTLIASGEVGYSLVRRQAETVRLAGGFDLISQKLDFGGVPFTDDQLRVLFARAAFMAYDRRSLGDATGYSGAEPRWRVGGSIEARKGLAILGASGGCGAAPLYAGCTVTPSLSRLDGDPRGALIRVSGSFELRPVPRVTLALSPRAQYAFDPLLSYEQYSGGNYTIGRGYDPGAVIGDSGIGFAAEVRLGRSTPRGARALALQPFGFVDTAWCYTRGPLNAGVPTTEIVSVGGGVRAALGRWLNLDVTAAAPARQLPQPVVHNGFRLLVSLTVRR